MSEAWYPLTAPSWLVPAHGYEEFWAVGHIPGNWISVRHGDESLIIPLGSVTESYDRLAGMISEDV